MESPSTKFPVSCYRKGSATRSSGTEKKTQKERHAPTLPPPRHPSNTDISNNVGSCQDLFGVGWFSLFLILGTLLPSLRRMVFSVLFSSHFDDHGSFVIFSVGFSPTYTSLRSKLRP